jgi:hypothetical protein
MGPAARQSAAHSNREGSLAMRLRVGDVVEVKSKDEILATLDERGMLDGLPFMPEMLAFAGRRFAVGRVAHKTCDTINASGGRRMRDAVHLEGMRCDGSAHGGCQAACTIFWKTTWLRKVTQDRPAATSLDSAGPAKVSESTLLAKAGCPELGRETHYMCQATELLRATEPLQWWEPTQYVRDVASGNYSFWVAARTLLLAGIRILIRTGVGFRALVALHDSLARRTGGRCFVQPIGPVANGARTPTSDLQLAAGDLVRVRPYDEILQTLNGMGRNRGLTFDPEMAPHCGATYRVRAVVDKIIDEKTGKMARMKGACIILDGVVCKSEYIRGRLMCPRAVFPYWRPIWLERLAASPGVGPAERSEK